MTLDTLNTLTNLDQRPDESAAAHAYRLLSPLVGSGSYPLSYTLDQLDRADRAAQLAVSGFGPKPSGTDLVTLKTLSETRHRIAVCRSIRLQQASRDRALIDAIESSPLTDDPTEPTPTATPTGPDVPQMTDQERACKLLSAALALILNPDQGPGDGGSKVPRVPVTPNTPTPSQALPVPVVPVPTPSKPTMVEDFTF